MVDELHERPRGTASNTFNRNKERFTEGYHYFNLPFEEWKHLFGITLNVTPKGGHAGGMLFFTEAGYLLLVKPFSDDRAWKVQDLLVRDYFTLRESVKKIPRSDFDKLAAKREAEETRVTTSVFKAKLAMAKAIGLKGNQAILCANSKTKEAINRDCLGMMGATHLLCEKQEVHLTASDLGKPDGLSGQKVNRILEAQGIIESRRDHKDRLIWMSTEKGRAYTVLKDTGKSHGNGTPVQQLMYLESAEQFLTEEPLLTATA